MDVIALHAASGGAAWLSFSTDTPALVTLPIIALWYARGLHGRGPRRVLLHPAWRVWCFGTGIAVLLVALVGPLDGLSDDLFAAHMGQHLLMQFIGVPFVLLGAPMVPVLRGIPAPLRRATVVRAARFAPLRWALRLLTHPLIAWAAFAGTLLGWHVPAAYDAALRSEPVHVAEHLTFVATATAFWWNVIDPVPLRPNVPYLLRLPYVFAMGVPAFVLGALLTHAEQVWYVAYAGRAVDYGLTPIEDQQVGGLLMWIPTSFVFLAAFMLVLAVTVRGEERRQRQLEQAGDAR